MSASAATDGGTRALHEPTDRRLWTAALLTAIGHAAAGAAAGIFVAPGAPAAPLAERLAILRQAGAGWRLAWLLWIPAGASLVWLFELVRRGLHPRQAAGAASPPGGGSQAATADRLPTAALRVATAALAIDACCDVAQAWWLPSLAAGDLAAFQRGERWLAFGSYTLANGLYSVATLLLTGAVVGRGGGRLLVTGAPLVTAGGWLAWLGVTASYRWVAAAAALTVVLCIAWSLQLAGQVTRLAPRR